MFRFTIKYFLCFAASMVYCEEYDNYNLIGLPGKAYSLLAEIGHPPQKLYLLVDTGSTTLAVASVPEQYNDDYFEAANSSSLVDTNRQVHAQYSEGSWKGHHVIDYVQFPDLPQVVEVKSNLVLITESKNFFINNAIWQGILGMAYPEVGVSYDDTVIDSWLNALDREWNRTASFELKLCGQHSEDEIYHYGNLDVFDDSNVNENKNLSFHTPILRKRWFEIGILSVRVLKSQQSGNTNETEDNYEIDESVAKIINQQKSIVDSGTTNIRVPRPVYRQILQDVNVGLKTSGINISDEFWARYLLCLDEPLNWSLLPWLAVDLLSAESDHQYFTLEIPPQNYMRLTTMKYYAEKVQFCYKLGVEPCCTETVLGYTAMEGFQVVFNRSANVISWQTSDCGPETRIKGPFNSSLSLTEICTMPVSSVEVATSIKAAQWALGAVSVVAAGVLIYLLGPCVKMLLEKRLVMSGPIAISQAALVDPEA